MGSGEAFDLVKIHKRNVYCDICSRSFKISFPIGGNYELKNPRFMFTNSVYRQGEIQIAQMRWWNSILITFTFHSLEKGSVLLNCGYLIVNLLPSLRSFFPIPSVKGQASMREETCLSKRYINTRSDVWLMEEG